METIPSKSSVEEEQVAQILPVPPELEEVVVVLTPNPSTSPSHQAHLSTIKLAMAVSLLHSMAQIPFSIALQGLLALVPIPLVLVPKVEQVQLVPQVLQAALPQPVLLQVQVTSKTMVVQVAQVVPPPTQVVVVAEPVAQMEPEELVVPATPTIQPTV